MSHFVSFFKKKQSRAAEMDFGLSSCFSSAVSVLLLLIFSLIHQQANAIGLGQHRNAAKRFQSSNGSCDFFTGSWVLDESYPLYDSTKCPLIEHEFNCQRNGRPDDQYLKYRWKPNDCELARFDGEDFLRRMKGKSIMFVGDSLSKNQYESLICLLHSAVPDLNYTMDRLETMSTFNVPEYGVSVMLQRNVYLVDIVRENVGRVLKLDSIENGKTWKDIDTLIFNTWHWWNRRGPSTPFDYIQEGSKIYKDMDRMVAYRKALTTWGKWVDSNVDPTKTQVFYQGVSPSHYNGSDWEEPARKNCLLEKEPISGSTYLGGSPQSLLVLKYVLKTISFPIYLLDVTLLSQLRKDGHPSMYGLGNPIGMDCSHWCLAGVPDTWNQLFYNALSFSTKNEKN